MFAGKCVILHIMIYVDVILPLPLDQLFTYSVPHAMQQSIGQGKRVLVPFGRSKICVGLISAVHDITPPFKVKPINMVLDDAAVVSDRQLQLWRWMADYYLSSIGEVYDAALPGGMKTTGAYKPKTEVHVALAPRWRQARALQLAMDGMKRAEKQLALLHTFLRMADIRPDEQPTESQWGASLSRDELLNESHVSVAVFRQLVQRGVLTTFHHEVGRLNDATPPQLDAVKPLSAAQQQAYDSICRQWQSKNVVLLHGVTSSGKTEIYIHLIRQTLDKGQQVLYLLPEIALTVQMRQRLQRVFGSRLGIYHSKYSDAERVEIWHKQLSAQPYDVILGARSAVLLPFSRLGLVIVDEEHETSFKQQDPAPRYHARSVAIMLARQYGAKTLLGSATPSVESYYNARQGKYGLTTLATRYNDMQLPAIQVVDVKDLQRRKMMEGMFSPQLLAAMRQALDSGRQVLLFQNRRGFAPVVECHACGWVPHCDHCDVSLSLHRHLGMLSCHYCGATYSVPEVCPCCGSRDLRGRGYGTEKIEDQVMHLFPDAKVARMDLDTTRSRDAYERIISDFSIGRTNVLVGTQMVSKGLDFAKVSVVGILNADSMLNYPDFRAYEHAFTMMLQVAGRAGRKDRPGVVILQTKSRQLPVITQVVRHDYASFFADQLEERKAFGYPPFCRLVYVYLKHADDVVVGKAAMMLGEQLRSWFGSRVLGPDRPEVSRVKKLHIRKLMLKLEPGIDLPRVRKYLQQAKTWLMQHPGHSLLQIYFDVDPQ